MGSCSEESGWVCHCYGNLGTWVQSTEIFPLNERKLDEGSPLKPDFYIAVEFANSCCPIETFRWHRWIEVLQHHEEVWVASMPYQSESWLELVMGRLKLVVGLRFGREE